MRKLILICITLFCFHFALGNNISNSEWVKIKAERKDGSRIIDRIGLENKSFKYWFKENTVMISEGEQYSIEEKFKIDSTTLYIGDYLKYNIDSVNEMLLIITEIPTIKKSDDKINTFIFINSQFIFEYLLQTKQIEISGDTVYCNNYFSPTYTKDDLGGLFREEFTYYNLDFFITGSMIMSCAGQILSAKINEENVLSKNDRDKFISTLIVSSGSWKMPVTTRSMSFKINFAFKYIRQNNFSGTSFSFYSKSEQLSIPQLSNKQVASGDEHFNKGLKQLKSEDYDKALKEFNRCIDIDSLFLEAYYNKAFCYFKLGKSILACDTWTALKEMGQKPAEEFYLQNCK